MERNKYPYIATYKMVLLGDGGVGKSTLIKRLRTGQFEENYERTESIISNERMLDHNRSFLYQSRAYSFRSMGHCWPRKVRKTERCLLVDLTKLSIKADCALIMFDLTSRTTLKNVPKWHRDLNRIVQNIPTVIVGNKCDDPNCKVVGEGTEYSRERDIPYFEISCVTNYQFELPFLTIMQQLVGDPNLKLVQAPSKSDMDNVNYSETDVVRFHPDDQCRRAVALDERI